MKRDDLKVGALYNLGAGKHDNWYFVKSRYVTRTSWKKAAYGGRLKAEVPAFNGGVWVHYFDGGTMNTTPLITESLAKVKPVHVSAGVPQTEDTT